MDRQLVDYVPEFLRKFRELKAIYNAEQIDVDVLWGDIARVMRNQFIYEADDYGISKWESFLHILPKDTDTLDKRRFKVIAMLNFTLPYTFRQLHKILASICGENGYRMALFNDDYLLAVKLALDNEENFNTVSDMLHRICPANLILNIYMFNTHRLLGGRFKHGEMRPYTHDQLRQELFL